MATTFKLRPLPEAERFVQARAGLLEAADQLVESVLNSEVTPTVLDLHNLENQTLSVVLGFAGNREEVEWQVDLVRGLGFAEAASLDYENKFWSGPEPVNRLSVPPAKLFAAIGELNGRSFVARAGNGVVYYRGRAPALEDSLPIELMRRLKDTFDPGHVLPDLPL
jgi:hypothetical protein